MVKFGDSANSHDVKDLFTLAAGLNRWSEIKLLDADGVMLCISSSIPNNKPNKPYKIHVVDTNHSLANDDMVFTLISSVSEQFNRVFKVQDFKNEIDCRLSAVERHVHVEGLKVVEVEKWKNDVKVIRRELHDLKNNSYGFTPINNSKYGSGGIMQPLKLNSVKKDVLGYTKYILSKETIEMLRKPLFEVWHWEPNEMLCLIEHMYYELDLVHEFNINPITLKKWLIRVQENYRDNPFHNFRHCFCVAQMMFGMINVCQLQDKMSKEDICELLTAAICHDLDHPGYNNTYQINARTELAVRYNDISPLENHHCAVTFEILNNPECNIFVNCSDDCFKSMRQGIIMLIMATDMARHMEIMDGFKEKIATFSYEKVEDLKSLKMILIKCCDISNEVRPMEVSEPWLDCLLHEYFMQSDREKLEGLPVAPFMDRDNVTKASTQIGFIKFVLLPMFGAVGEIFPQISDTILQQLTEALIHYEHINKA